MTDIPRKADYPDTTVEVVWTDEEVAAAKEAFADMMSKYPPGSGDWESASEDLKVAYLLDARDNA